MESVNDDCIVFEQKNCSHISFPILEKFQLEGKFCDVILQADGEILKAHKIILCATIPYFHAMFTADMVESRGSEVTLQGIEAETLRSFVNFSYSGKIIIGTKTVQSLLIGAGYLQLTQVKEACENFLIERLEESSVLGISKFADAVHSSSLAKACKQFIEENFTEVCLHDEFLNLPVEELMELLSNDDLNVSSEQQVFEAVIRWLKKDPICRKEHLPHLLSKVRLALLSIDYLTTNVFKEEFIKSSIDCRNLIDEVKDYHLMRKRKEFMDKGFKTEPRFSKSLGNLIFAMGGLSESGQCLNTMELYDPSVGEWSLTEPMDQVCSRVAVAVHKKLLMVIGGSKNVEPENTMIIQKTVQAFDSATKEWLDTSPMETHRRSAGAAVLNDKLYVCGGYNGTQSLYEVECYDFGLNLWSFVESMNYKRTSCGVVALNDYLYALGGHDGTNVHDEVERYDPCTDTWTEVAPMLTKRCRLGAASLRGKLYACGGYDGDEPLRTVEMYDPKDDTWQMIEPMRRKRSRVTLITTMGKLWAIGGCNGKQLLRSVEIYDPKSGKWTDGPPLCELRGEVGVGVIPIAS